jgi:hypothetical protein
MTLHKHPQKGKTDWFCSVGWSVQCVRLAAARSAALVSRQAHALLPHGILKVIKGILKVYKGLRKKWA